METISTSKLYSIFINMHGQCYDIDELDCMFQQVLAIHLGWADQITPEIVEEIEYVWQNT